MVTGAVIALEEDVAVGPHRDRARQVARIHRERFELVRPIGASHPHLAPGRRVARCDGAPVIGHADAVVFREALGQRFGFASGKFDQPDLLSFEAHPSVHDQGRAVGQGRHRVDVLKDQVSQRRRVELSAGDVDARERLGQTAVDVSNRHDRRAVGRPRGRHQLEPVGPLRRGEDLDGVALGAGSHQMGLASLRRPAEKGHPFAAG